MAVLSEKMDKLEAEKKAQSKNVDLLREQISQHIVAGNFAGKWKRVELSGGYNEYSKQFGYGFLYWHRIRKIGKFIIFIFKIIYVKLIFKCFERIK